MNTTHNTTTNYRVTLIRSERATLREKLEYPAITEVVITSPSYIEAKAQYDQLNTGSEIDKELHAFNESEGFNVLIESTYIQSELNTFDVYFDDDNNSNCKGFYNSFEECYDYIKNNNGTNNSYFEDYKGGIVSIVCNNNSITVYQTEVLKQLPRTERYKNDDKPSVIDSNRVMVDFNTQLKQINKMEKQVETNRVIAEFMGYEVIPYQHNEFRPIYNGNRYAKTVGEQKALWGGLDLQFTGRFTEQVKYPFDTDFNYLLPVIRMIEEQGYVVAIKGISYQIYKIMDEQNPIASLVCGDLTKKTEMVCDLLVAFIKHLNKH